jgi:hypothetical protein
MLLYEFRTWLLERIENFAARARDELYQKHINDWYAARPRRKTT